MSHNYTLSVFSDTEPGNQDWDGHPPRSEEPGSVGHSPTPDRTVTSQASTDDSAEQSQSRASVSTHRREVYPGDVLYFPRKDCHGWIPPQFEHDDHQPTTSEAPGRPQGVPVVWVDGFAPGLLSCRVSLDSLDDLVQRGDLRVSHSGIEDPWETWGLGALEQGGAHIRKPSADVNQTAPTTIVPRRHSDSLTVTREVSFNVVNGVLEHPLVDHKRGSVNFWKAAFGARTPSDSDEPGPLCAVTTLTRPSAQQLCEGTTYPVWNSPDDANTPPDQRVPVSSSRTIELSRFGSHPDTHSPAGTTHRSANTASWLLSHVFNWARVNGFETILSYSGVANQNPGSIYQASNFKFAGTSDSDGAGWTNRDGRDQWKNSRSKRRWLAVLREPTWIEPRASSREQALTTHLPFQGDELSVSDYALTREEVPERDHGRAASFFEDHGVFAETDTFAALADRVANRPEQLSIFGADHRGRLGAALAVVSPEDRDESDQLCRLVGYASNGSAAYPSHVFEWLASTAYEWARYEGIGEIALPPCIVPEGTSPASLHFRGDTTPRAEGALAERASADTVFRWKDSPQTGDVLPVVTAQQAHRITGPYECYR